MSNSFHPRIGLSITPEERHIINMYMSQYNQTNVQINRLYTTLDSIRTNINNIVNNIVNNNRDNRYNRDNMSTVEPAQGESAAYQRTSPTTSSTTTAYPRTTPTPITHAYPPTANASYSSINNRSNTNNRNNNSNNRRNNQYIFYDYDRPISPTTYIDDDIPVNISDNINTLLAAFLATPVTVRPTEAQISAATRIIRYSDIENPASTACPISLDNFSENDNVRQINHCGHVFSLNSIDEWFQNNVRCPVCRYDIRTATAATDTPDLFEPPLTNTNANTRQNVSANARQNVRTNASVNPNTRTNTNTLQNARQATTDALDSITNSLFESLLSYPARINGTRTPRSTTANTNTNVNDNDNDNDERLTYDASQNTLTYETTFRPYHR